MQKYKKKRIGLFLYLCKLLQFGMGIIIRQSIKGTIVNYIGVAIGFFTTFFVITNYLTQEEVGLTRVLVDAGVLFASLSQIGTGASILRFFPYFKDDENKHHGFFFWTIVVPLIGFLIFLAVYLLLKKPIVAIFSKNSPLFVNYFRFVIPIALFMLYQYVFEANSNVLMRIVIPKFVREVGIRLGLLVIYILYGRHIIDLDGLVLGFCITYFLAALVDILYLFSLQKISLKPDFKFLTKPLRRDFLFYTLFLVMASIAGTITPLLSSFFVTAKMGLTFTGIFAIANYIATVIEIPNRSLNAIAQPNLSEAIKNQDWTRADELCKSVSLHLLLSSFFIFFIIWINVDLLFMILRNGELYTSGKSVIFILGLARLSNSAFSISSNALSFSKYYYLTLVFTFLLTISSVVLNILLIPSMGMNGAALANFLSYFIYFIFLLILLRWKLKISLFSIGQLKIIAIIALLFGLNALWTSSLTPLIMKIPFNPLAVSILEGGIRTAVLVGIGITLVYCWKVSADVNRLIDKVIKRKNA